LADCPSLLALNIHANLFTAKVAKDAKDGRTNLNTEEQRTQRQRESNSSFFTVEGAENAEENTQLKNQRQIKRQIQRNRGQQRSGTLACFTDKFFLSVLRDLCDERFCLGSVSLCVLCG
jgi:hypothetical protein